MSQIHGIQISAGTGGAPLTPQQKRFNTLIKQTDQARQTLAAWHDNISLFGQAHAKRIAPLIESLSVAGRDMVILFDRLLDQQAQRSRFRHGKAAIARGAEGGGCGDDRSGPERQR